MARRRRAPPRTLSIDERGRVLFAMHEPRFVDLAPAEVYATLLEEGRFHPRPELLATRPNELWSWDITRLEGPAKWTYF